MQQAVKVLTCDSDGTAKVVLVRQSACSGDCHKCSGCGAVEQKMVLTVNNPIGARPGELVTIESDSAPVLRGAAILYLLPLALFIPAYLWGMQWRLGALTGFAAFALGIGAAVVYDRCVVKKENTIYTIVGYGGSSPGRKGDNTLD